MLPESQITCVTSLQSEKWVRSHSDFVFLMLTATHPPWKIQESLEELNFLHDIPMTLGLNSRNVCVF